MLCLLLSSALAGDWATVRLQDGFAVSLEEDAIGVDAYGRPHIVWGGQDTVHHALLDGTWSVEEVVPPGDLDGPAVHATAVVRNQTVYVAWSDGWGPPWWAEGSWGDWTSGPVWTAGPMSRQPVIGIAPDGTVYLTDADVRLMLARLDGAIWVDQVADLTLGGGRPDLVFASDSTPYVVFEDGLDLRYTDLAGVQQTPAVVGSVVPALGPVAAAVDGSDHLVVGVHDGDQVRLLRNVGADWSSWTVALAPNVGLAPALSVDPGGLVHLAFTDDTYVRYALETSPGTFLVEDATTGPIGPVSVHATAGEVHLAHVGEHVLSYGKRDSGGAWWWEEVARTHHPGFGVAAVHDGTGVWAAHQDGGDPADGLPRRLALTWSDGTDVENTLESSGDVFPFTDLALGSDGLLRATRVDEATLELILMTGQAGSWTLEVASLPGIAPQHHALALDPATDHAVVAYVTALGEVFVATQDTSGWVVQVVPGAYGDVVDVAVDADGFVHVVWGDPDTRDAMYGVGPLGGALTVESLEPMDQVATCGREVTIGADDKGFPRVMYDCEDRAVEMLDIGHSWRVVYARLRNDGTWEKGSLGPLTSAVTGLDLLVEEGGTTDFAFTEADGPVYVGSNGGGTQWSLDLVATAGGGDVALAQAPDDTLYAVWQDPDRWDLNLSLARPELSVDPMVVDFGEVYTSETAEEIVTITNTGTTDYTLPPPVVEGPNPQAFELVGTCFSVLQPTQVCSWTVRFSPDHAWTRTAVLRIAPGYEVVLQGTGVGVFDTSGCGSCGGCQQGTGAAPWGLTLLLVALVRRRRCSSAWRHDDPPG